MTRLTQIALVALIVVSAPADAAERGHITLSYQQIRADGIDTTVGEIDVGVTDTQTLGFDLVYHLDERISLHLGIPLVRKRYHGTLPHDPSLIVPPEDADFVDDGDWHTDFQDFRLGISYAWIDRPVRVEPFIYYGLPSHDYPHFGNAAVGQNVWRVEFGSSLTYRPPLSDWYLNFVPSYNIVEKTLGVNVNHWRLHAEVGYRFAGGIVGRMFVNGKEGKGLDFPADFPPPPRNDEMWYEHDRLVKHNYVNAGLGVDWSLSPDVRVSTALFTMVHADIVHIMDYALSLSVTRSF